jgi:hypothetical protein
MVMTPFEHWWYHEGSQPPAPGLDMEEHCKRMCKIAWDNGAYKEREACAEVVEKTKWSNWFQADAAAAIRARSQL